MIKKIESPSAPKPVGPYSQGISCDNLFFLSGQIGIDPKTNILKEDVEKQTRQILENIKSILDEAGLSFKDVVKCDIFLTNISDFEQVNEIYQKFFLSLPYPARQTIAVAALPKNALVEISCIAYNK